MEAVQPKSRSMKVTKTASKVGLTILILFFVCVYLFPFFLCVITAMKTPLETAQNPLALPAEIQWENFSEAMRISQFGVAIKNSLITTGCGVLLVVFCSSLSGYIIARSPDRKFFRFVDKLFLASLMLPFQVIMIPLYRLFKQMNLMNNLFGVIIMLVGTSVAYSTFLIVGFVKGIPKELEEAAEIDGCGPYRRFYSVVFPLLSPIVSTVAALHVMWLWNEFNISLILLQKDAVRTVPVKQFFFFGEYTIKLNLGFAGAVISMIPILIFFIFVQKYLAEGIMAGAVKG